VVILDGGTTTLQVARHLPLDLQATIVTNSPPIAIALAEHPLIEVVMLGGQLYKKALVNVGAATVEALGMIRADLCLLGVCSLHPEVGISVQNLDEAHVKRAMISRSAEVVGLATAAKLDTAATYVVGPIQALTYLVTASTVATETLTEYKDLGLTVIRDEDLVVSCLMVIVWDRPIVSKRLLSNVRACLARERSRVSRSLQACPSNAIAHIPKDEKILYY
jgi:DeoR/GlpR family transcriptional regulator of sugar metabolism